MSTLQTQIMKLLASAPGAKPVYLDVTDWLYGLSYEDIETIIRTFRKKFRAKRSEMVALFDRPIWTLPRDRAWFDRWYPECLEGAVWEFADKVLCLAVDHHDKETPVALLLRCLTNTELAKLSESE